jgi:7-cyano-7-deazaguanine reductase
VGKLAQLGQITEVPASKDAGVLETITNYSQDQKFNVKLVSSEYTSLCPVTGQPDFGTIEINYVPADSLVETKSLKMYLASYRNEKIFNEAAVNTILNDLVVILKPSTIEVKGTFAQRGGIQLTITASYPES